jgi:maleate cis-trans isomerase
MDCRMDRPRTKEGLREDRTGEPTTTSSTAGIEDFKELGIRTLSAETPSVDSVNRIEMEFFDKHRVEMLNIRGCTAHDG